MGVIREPLAVLLGLLAFACAAGAAWQAGLAWPAAAGRPLARVAAACAVVLAAFGFSLGYWEVLSGVGDLFYSFSAPTTRFLFDIAAIGLPLSVVGLVLGVASTVHATDVPARAVVPAILAGYAIGWLVDPYGVLAGPRMDPVRSRYAASLVPVATYGSAPAPAPAYRGGNDSLFDRLGNWNLGGEHDRSGNGGGDPGQAAVILLLIALAVLAVAGGVITAGLTFAAARKKAKAQLARMGV